MTNETLGWLIVGVMLLQVVALLRLHNRIAEVWQWSYARSFDSRLRENVLARLRVRDHEVRALHRACTRKCKRIAKLEAERDQALVLLYELDECPKGLVPAVAHVLGCFDAMTGAAAMLNEKAKESPK